MKSFACRPLCGLSLSPLQCLNLIRPSGPLQGLGAALDVVVQITNHVLNPSVLLLLIFCKVVVDSSCHVLGDLLADQRERRIVCVDSLGIVDVDVLVVDNSFDGIATHGLQLCEAELLRQVVFGSLCCD